MTKVSITIPRLFWCTLPALSVEIDAKVEEEFHLKVAVETAVSDMANLDGANLYGANLDGANLYGANLTGASLDGANLTGANLTGASLDGANLTGANLTMANLYRANLTGASLDGANLTGANLTGASLYGASLDGATSLLCAGDMRRIRTMQFDTWHIGWSATHLQIGCQRHEIAKWRKWDTPAGKKWIAAMNPQAETWAMRNLALILALVDANPAT